MPSSDCKFREEERGDTVYNVRNGAGDEDTGHGDQHPGDGHLLAVRLCCRRLATSPRCRASQLDGRDDGGDGGGQEEEDGQSQPVHHDVKDVNKKFVLQVELAGEVAFLSETLDRIKLTENSVFVGHYRMNTNKGNCTDNDDDSRHFGL